MKRPRCFSVILPLMILQSFDPFKTQACTVRAPRSPEFTIAKHGELGTFSRYNGARKVSLLTL